MPLIADLTRLALMAGAGFLAACGTPQEQCIASVTRDIRVLDRLIGESEANLRRGYGMEEYIETDSRLAVCRLGIPPTAGRPGRPPQYCWRDYDRVVSRPVTIDLARERANLSEMRKKRQGLMKAAQPAIAQCRATYPE
ncbi:MAG: hypothetical protein ACK5M4_07185 [Pseudorhodobacter sp.]